MEWFEAQGGWPWLVLAVVLAGLEVLTLDLVLLMLAAGAAAAGVAGLLGAGLGVEVAVFAVVSVLMLAAVRPVALRHLRRDTGADASYLDRLPGRRVVADTALTERGGLLVVGGETWTARVEPGSPDVAPGEEVTILRVDGAALLVRPLPRIDWGDAAASDPDERP